MVKPVFLAECDVCGFWEKAKPTRDICSDIGVTYELPQGWIKPRENSDFCICPKCWAKFNGGRADDYIEGRRECTVGTQRG